jgi:hypothetical protein
MRNELDSKLLRMDISHESFRKISQEYGYSEFALRRHKENHLTVDLGDLHEVMVGAREQVLAEIREKTVEEVKTAAADSTAGKLAVCVDFFGEIKTLRDRAASFLDRCEELEDLKSAGQYLRELRSLVELMSKLEDRLAARKEANQLTSADADMYLQRLLADRFRVLTDEELTALEPILEKLEIDSGG